MTGRFVAHRVSLAARSPRKTILMALALSAILPGLLLVSGRVTAQTPATRPAVRDPSFAPISDDPRLPRVLLIGDSISMGYTLPTRALLAGKANVHRPPENCGPTTRGLERLEAWLGSGRWDVIHFNFGLHDLKYIDGKHQVSLEDYQKNLQAIVKRLKQTGARLVWCSTTPVPATSSPPRHNKDVLAYNAAAGRIMEENGIPIDDLYAFAQPQVKEIQRPNNVHFTAAGSKALAGHVAECIRQALSARPAESGKNAARPAKRPNILYIMADDHAAHAMSCYDSAVNKTPNIDRIATAGIRFDNCFCTNSICTPSRATIITGKYSHINGVPVFNRFDGSQPTVAKYLQAAGYHTGMIGKWHLGSDPTGFDYWEILPGQGRYFNPVFYTATQTRTINGYVSDVITDLAIDFLKNRPKDRPFFLMCHHKAPHRPWDPDAKYKAMFAGRHIPEPPTLRDDYATRTDALHENRQRVFYDMTRRDLKLQPPAGLKGRELSAWLGAKPTEVEIEVNGQKKVLRDEELNEYKYQRYMQDYLACIQSVDDNVGRLLDWLDAHGLADNTLVIYTSDQGFFLGDHGLFDKRFMYEEALRMPFIARWPGVIKSGSVQKAMALNVDFAPTFMDAAGLSVPPDMQGRSLLPLLRGQAPADWRTSMYYRYYDDPGAHNTRVHYGLRTEAYTLIYFWTKDQWELYDLKKDPQELHNVYNDPAYAQVRDKLKAELYRLKEEVKDNDQFADKQLPDGVDVPPPRRGG